MGQLLYTLSMASPRKRYVVTGNVSINDVNMKGQVYQLVGMCDSSGGLKRPDGKPIFKKYRTHYLLQVNDKKDLRDKGLKVDSWFRIVVNPEDITRFYKEVEVSSE